MKILITKTTALILLLTLVLSLLLSCNDIENTTATPSDTQDSVKEYAIHSDIQRQYLEGDYDFFSLYAKGKEELSLPVPVVIEWNDKLQGRVTLSLSEDYSSPMIFEGEGKVEIYNLFIGTTYYYKIEKQDGTLISQDSFKTSDIAPRNLNVDALTNTRDIGGWKKADGGMIKQGMIYRSSKLTADDTGEPIITDKGIEIMRNDLGIVTEIDLRRTETGEQGGITQSVLGDGVKYISFPMKSSGNCLILNKESLPELFEILADESNYPLVFHCSIGTDRTGVVAFLINALLGASEESLYKDYLFSNFGNIGGVRTSSAVKNYLTTVSMQQGDDLAEKTYNYLISVGVDSTKIDSFIAIMTK